MAFVNPVVLVWEHFVNWSRSVYIYIYAFLCVYVLIICFVNCNIYNTLSASNLLYCSNPKWCRCFETQLTNRLFSNMTHGKAESWLAERPPSRGYSQPIRKRIPDDVTMTSPGDMLNDLIYYIWAICTLGDIPIEYPHVVSCCNGVTDAKLRELVN